MHPCPQVFCNALVPTCLALAAAYYSGGVDLALGQAPAVAAAAAGISPATLTRMLTALHGAFLGYYACCCGDTWSSELGQLRWVVYPGMVCVHGAWEQSGRVVEWVPLRLEFLVSGSCCCLPAFVLPAAPRSLG
jgi:hypothetical protein